MGSSGGHNSVELRDGSHISATTTANAINITSGLSTQLALDRATIDGDTLLTASNTIATTMADSQLNGDVVLKSRQREPRVMTGSGLSVRLTPARSAATLACIWIIATSLAM